MSETTTPVSATVQAGVAPGALDVTQSIGATDTILIVSGGKFVRTTTAALAALLQPAAGLTSLNGAVLLSGSVMEGPLILAGDPTAALGAAPKQYVDAQVSTAEASLAASLTGGVASAETFATAGDVATLSAAKSYADTGSATAAAATKALDRASFPVPNRLWNSVIPFWGVSEAPVQTIQLTSGIDFSLDGEFTGIQLIFANPGPTVTLPSVVFAPSASAASKTTPVDATGAPVPWTESTQAGANGVTLAAGTPAQRTITLGDIMPVQSLPRTDGGLFSLLYVRETGPSTGSWTPNYTTNIAGLLDLAQYNIDNGGRTVELYYAGADFTEPEAVAEILTDANAALGSAFNYCIGVRYLSPNRVVTLMPCGDSLTAGFETKSGYNGFGLQTAVALSKQMGIGVALAAHGFPAQVSADFAANAAAAIEALQPDIITFPIDSPNDYTGITQGSAAAAAAMVAMQQRALTIVDLALSRGILPVLLTPIPFGAYDTAANYGALRVQAGQFARLLTSRGALLLDAQAIISGYVPSASQLPTLPAQYTASDGAHLNDAGHALLAAALTALLAPLL
jgi:lysophospholipase L1-like esterase